MSQTLKEHTIALLTHDANELAQILGIPQDFSFSPQEVVISPEEFTDRYRAITQERYGVPFDEMTIEQDLQFLEADLAETDRQRSARNNGPSLSMDFALVSTSMILYQG